MIITKKQFNCNKSNHRHLNQLIKLHHFNNRNFTNNNNDMIKSFTCLNNNLISF